jgi:6-phosphofructokinase 2
VPNLGVPIAGHTRESLTVHEEQSGKEYRFVLPGPELSAAELDAVFETLSGLDPRPAYLIASGSLPPGVGEDFAGRLADTARGLGARLVLDAPGKALRAEAGLGVYLVKPNLGELEEMAGCKLDDDDAACAAARKLIGDGVAEVVVLSLGADGARLVTDTACTHFDAIQVDSVSAVGAGDAMLAGLVLALSRGESLEDAMRYAMASGAAATLRPGTQLVRREDVERLLEESA